MGLLGEWAEVKRLRDFGVGWAFGDELEDFAFSAGELVEPVVFADRVRLPARRRCRSALR
jgi:hypothetical protein